MQREEVKDHEESVLVRGYEKESRMEVKRKEIIVIVFVALSSFGTTKPKVMLLL